jgi:hypothetical protein
MVRSTLLLACAAVSLAQTPKPPANPPADVDRALRARVEEFFQYHVTGEFRKAEALVAEDTKDLFYNRNKPRYLKFVNIDHINYNDDFTKATAIVMVVSPEMIAGWVGGPPTLPIPSTWKIEDGKWYFYLEPETFLRTPFGNISLNAASKAAPTAPGMMPPGFLPAGSAPSGISMPGMPPMAGPPMGVPGTGAPAAPQGVDPAAMAAIAGANQLGMAPAGIQGAIPAEMMDKIKPDKTEIILSAGKSEKITFANSAGDVRSLMVLGGVPGVTAKLDHPDVKGGEKAELTLEAGKDAKDGVFRLAVPQTGEVFSIKIVVK